MHSISKVGSIKNGYLIEKLVGKGSYGVVYKVTREAKEFAMKFIEISLKNLDSPNEFYILNKLDNVNVLKVFESFDLDSNFCVVMEYLETNLRDLLNSVKSFNYGQIFIWTKSIINGLDYLHDNKVIHRDIKPENILLTKELCLKIADFGMARIVDSVSMNSFKGTLGYMSKEVVEGVKYTFKADIWSAGCVVFELIFSKKFCDFKNSKENENFSQEIPEKLAKLIKNMLIESQEERADSKLLINLINNLENSPNSETITYKELCEKKLPLKITTRLFPEFEYKFIGRRELINKVKLNLQEKQGVILSAFGGSGKSRLAHEIGKLLHEEKYIVRVLSGETKEKLLNDYNQLYREIFKLKDYNFNNKNFEEVIQDVKNAITFADSKLVFILDNVEEYEHIKEVVESLPDDKVKLIITTRNTDLISQGNQLKNKTETQLVDLFNKEETKEYLEVNLNKRDDLNEDVIDELIEIKLENNEVLPLDLYLTVNYINNSDFEEIDQLLEDIKKKKSLSVETDSSRSLYIAQCLFKKLHENSQVAFKLLVYCAFLDPEKISFKLVNFILSSSASNEAVRHLAKYGLVNKFNRNLKIHRLIQKEIKEYSQKNVTSFDLNEKAIVQDLTNIFLEKIETIDGNSLIISDQADTDYNQIEKMLKEFKKANFFQIEFSKMIRLKLKYANYSFYKVNFSKSKEEFFDCYQLLKRDACLENEYKLYEILALSGLGRVYLEMDNLIKSLEYFQKSHNVISSLPQNNEIAKLDFLAQYYYFFGVLYNKIGKSEKAFKYHELSYDLRKEKNDQNFEIVDSLNAIAQYHENANDLNEAAVYRLKANQIAEQITQGSQKIPYHPKLAETLENLGFICEKLGNIKQEIEYHLNAHNMKFKIYKYREINEQMAKSYEYVANLNRKLENKYQELKYREKCVEIKKKLYEDNYERNYLKSLRFLARVYEEIKDFENCEKIYETMCSILNKIEKKYDEEIIEIKYNLAMCNILQNKKEIGFSVLNEIATTFKKYNYNKYFKMTLVFIDQLDKESKKMNKELDYFRNNTIVTCSWDSTIKIWNLENGECLKTLEGHTNQISCLIKLSYNLLASGSWNNEIKIWNIEIGECVKTLLGHANFVSCLLELSNNHLASASWDKTVKIWDLNSGDCLKTLISHSDWVYCLVQFSNDILISGSKDKTIKIWIIETEECLKTLEEHLGPVNCLKQLSNDLFASGSDDNTIKIWSFQSGECVKSFKGYSYIMTGFIALPNDLLISASNDNTVKIWNIKSGECIRVLAKQLNSVSGLALLNNSLLASSSFSEIRIWNIDTGECLRKFKAHSSYIGFLVALPHSLLASVSNDLSIKIWNIETGECLRTLKGHTTMISDIKTLSYNLINISEHDLNDKDRIRNLETGSCLNTLEGHSSSIISLELLESNLLMSGSYDQMIKLWNLDNGECLRTFKKDLLPLNCVASLNGNTLLAYSSENLIKIVNLETEDFIDKTLSGHSYHITCLLVLKNDCIASGSRDNTIKIWNAITGECLKTLRGHKGEITSLAKLSNNRLASGALDMLINIWHVETGECLRTLNINSYKLLYLTATPDGVMSCKRWDEQNGIWIEDNTNKSLSRVTKKYFFSTTCLASLSDNFLASATTENVILIWNIEKSVCLRKLTGHKFSIKCLSVLINKFLASGSSDNTIRIWNTDTSECLITLQGHSNEVKSLISLSNNLIVSGSRDATIKIWKFYSFLSFHHSACNSFIFSISILDNCLYFGCDSNFFCYKEYNFHQINFDFKCFVRSFVIFKSNSINYLALACSDHSIKVFTQDNFEFSFSYELRSHSNFVSCLTFMSETNTLISGSDDQTIRFWSVNAQKCDYVIKAHENTVKCLLISSNNNIISGSIDKTVKIWNSQTKELFFNSDWSKKSHLDEVNCLINLPSNRFASGSLDKNIKVWNSLTGDLFHTIDNCGSVYSLLFLPLGYIVAGCEKDIYVIDITNDEIMIKNVIIRVLKGHEREVTCLVLAENNSYFVSASVNSSFIYWNIESI